MGKSTGRIKRVSGGGQQRRYGCDGGRVRGCTVFYGKLCSIFKHRPREFPGTNEQKIYKKIPISGRKGQRKREIVKGYELKGNGCILGGSKIDQLIHHRINKFPN